MKIQKRYPKEVRERAVRLVLEQQNDHGSQWGAIRSIASNEDNGSSHLIKTKIDR